MRRYSSAPGSTSWGVFSRRSRGSAHSWPPTPSSTVNTRHSVTEAPTLRESSR